MIDKATIDKIFQRVDIVEVISDFVSLTKKGTNYQACCPFHGEKTPSFVVSPARGIYKCFGCGKGGNAISFIMDHENMTYPEALRYAAAKYGIEIEERELSSEEIAQRSERESMMQITAYAAQYFQQKLHNSTEGRNVALTYFRQRGISDQSIEKFQLGYCTSEYDLFSRSSIEQGHKEQHLVSTGLTILRDGGGYYDRFTGRVMFPIHSISGRVIAFGGRTLSTEKKVAKYLNSPESEIYHKSSALYGIFQAKGAIVRQNKCILVEGYTDVISLHQSGIENVVASSGTSLTEGQIALIRRFTNNITIIYDGDSAGIKASMRGINMVLREGLNVRIVPLPEGEDPDTFARSRSAEETLDYIFNNEEDFISFKAKMLLNDIKHDPIAKTGAIHDMVESISVIKDEILKTEYIKECARIMDIDEHTLTRQVFRHSVGEQGGRKVFENYRDKRGYTPQMVSAPPPATKRAPKSALAAVYEMEKELVTYLIKNGGENFTFKLDRQQSVELNIATVIIEEMESDELHFISPLYNTIFVEYKRLMGEGDDITANMFINFPDAAVSDFIVDIMTLDERYRHSKIWSKHTLSASGDVKLSEAIPKCIALYKLKRLEMLISERRELLRSGNSDTILILKEINSLNESRKAVCSKYERLL